MAGDEPLCCDACYRAVGLHEALDEDYLLYRIRSTTYLGEHIAQAGLPIVQPPGGHAIYMDAAAFFPHTGVETSAPMELVRLAIPRRVYTQSHIDYVVEAILQVWERRREVRGYRFVEQAPFEEVRG